MRQTRTSIRCRPTRYSVDQPRPPNTCTARSAASQAALLANSFACAASRSARALFSAVGAAWAAKLKGDDTVAMAFMGDGATSSNDFHVAMNFAGVFKVPVVFVCQNNHWSISVPTKHQTASESIAVKATAYGLPGVKVDGNDPEAMFEVTRLARERALAGEGPTLIEAVTMRMHGHAAHDDMKYVPTEKVEE